MKKKIKNEKKNKKLKMKKKLNLPFYNSKTGL